MQRNFPAKPQRREENHCIYEEFGYHMTFILVPNKGEDIQINAWNWRPTIEFLRVAGTITDKESDLLVGNLGYGGSVDEDLAQRIADAVENKLSGMKPGDRIRADLTVTSEPKVLQVFGPDTRSEDIDDLNLYSATYDWLVMFRDFCKRCEGFKVS